MAGRRRPDQQGRSRSAAAAVCWSPVRDRGRLGRRGRRRGSAQAAVGSAMLVGRSHAGTAATILSGSSPTTMLQVTSTGGGRRRLVHLVRRARPGCARPARHALGHGRADLATAPTGGALSHWAATATGVAAVTGRWRQERCGRVAHRGCQGGEPCARTRSRPAAGTPTGSSSSTSTWTRTPCGDRTWPAASGS